MYLFPNTYISNKIGKYRIIKSSFINYCCHNFLFRNLILEIHKLKRKRQRILKDKLINIFSGMPL